MLLVKQRLLLKSLTLPKLTMSPTSAPLLPLTLASSDINTYRSVALNHLILPFGGFFCLFNILSIGFPPTFKNLLSEKFVKRSKLYNYRLRAQPKAIKSSISVKGLLTDY